MAGNPSRVITVRLKDIDLVLEGEARRTTDPAQLEAVAALFRAGDWPAHVEGGPVAVRGVMRSEV